MAKRACAVWALVTAGLAGCGAPTAALDGTGPATLQARGGAALPVLLVHGHGGSHVDLDPVNQDLTAHGRQVFTVDFTPNDGTVEQCLPQLEARVDQVLAQTGASQLDLVAHSMGGITSRWFIKFAGGARVVDHLVMVSTPNHGITEASLASDPGARELAPDSPIMTRLDAGAWAPGPVKYTSIWSHADQYQLLPLDSARLPGAVNDPIWGLQGHTEILSDPAIWPLVRQGLAR